MLPVLTAVLMFLRDRSSMRLILKRWTASFGVRRIFGFPPDGSASARVGSLVSHLMAVPPARRGDTRNGCVRAPTYRRRKWMALRDISRVEVTSLWGRVHRRG
ncbi:unnamed protein product [Ectocarpus sp. 12 AP-2014]